MKWRRRVRKRICLNKHRTVGRSLVAWYLKVIFFLWLGFVPLASLLADPLWWQYRGVLDTSQSRDDYAAINIGQLKHMVYSASAEIDAMLPGSISVELSTLINEFNQNNFGSNDFAAVNVGQLKAVAKPIYDILISNGVRQEYPWSDTDINRDDYAMVNVGQLKYVFDFEVQMGSFADSDNDGLLDSWEFANWSGLGFVSGSDDSDEPTEDGLTNQEEYWLGTDPKVAALIPADGDIKVIVFTNF